MNDADTGPEMPEAQGTDARQQRFQEDWPRSSTIGIGSSIGVGCLIVVVVFIVAAFVVRWIFGSW